MNGTLETMGITSCPESDSGCPPQTGQDEAPPKTVVRRQVLAVVDDTRAKLRHSTIMSSDAVDSSPAPVFKRSTNKKPRPRRERSPGDIQLDLNTPLSTQNADPADSALVEESPMTQAAKLKAKLKSRNKLQGRLSFGGDDSDATGDEFKVKKSALSRKLTIPAPPSTPGSSAPTQLNQASYLSQSTPGLYSKDYLSELKASTPSTPAFKTRPTETSTDFDGDVSMSYDDVDDSFAMDSLTSIPTEAAIKATKEKRARLQKMGPSVADSTSEDFVSLSLTKREPSKDQGPHPESRLQREDDDLGEGDEDMAEYTEAKDRVALGKKSRKAEARKRKATIAELIDDAEEDDDDDMKDWENSLLKRGGQSVRDEEPSPEDKTYKPRPIPNVTTLPSLTVAMSRLSGTLSDAQGKHTVHQNDLEAIHAEQTQLDAKENEMRSMVASAEAKRAWMSDFYEWMETIATFLDEKFPTLEKLEEEHLSLFTERQDMLNKRRREDDEDDISLCLYVPPPTEQDDEFGRSMPQGPRAPTREARRTSRAARFSTTFGLSIAAPSKLALSADDQIGYVTDGELLPADLEDYTLAMEKLSHRVASLLDDVKSNEFRDPSLGLAKRFAEWRDKWPDSYSGAWGGLGMVGAWEFWTRLEMVEWNPLEDGRPLDSFRWYSALYEYSRPRSVSEDAMDTDGPHEHELGPDGDLVASMVSTTIIPLLCKFFASGGVDPYSAKHMKRVVDLAEQIELCVDQKEAKFQTFAKALLFPFQRAVEDTHNLIRPSLDPSNPAPPFDPGSIPARRQFLVRRIKVLTNLLVWRKAVGAITGIDDLIRRLLVEVMLPVAMGGWDVGGQELMSKAKSLLPKDLARQEWTRSLQ